MSDHLRDAIRDAVLGDMQFAEKLADAFREVIDERIEAAKPQPAEPRRNPYEDWGVDDPRAFFYSAQVRRLLIHAWNEGAQIAGERDE